jgi:cell division protein FtsB
MSDKGKKIKATEDRGSLDLTRQLDESELAFKTLKEIIHNLQEENKRYKQENKNLKQQITNLEREAEEMLLYP